MEKELTTEKLITEGKIPFKKRRGRKDMDMMIDLLMGKNCEQLKRTARDRQKW